MKKLGTISLMCPCCNNYINVEVFNKPKACVCEDHVLSYKQLHKYFATYLNSIKAVRKLRESGIVIGQKDLFAYLRKKGYLSEEDMSYNHPTFEASSKGWIVVTWSSRGFASSKRRIFTPHFSPGFINLIEKELKEGGWL